MKVPTTSSRAHPERVTPFDMSNLRVEEHGMPMHVTAVVLLDGAPLMDSGGELLLADIRRHVECRTSDTARLRQVLVWPRRGRPTWVHDPAFDIDSHVVTRRVPEPGDEQSLLDLCCELDRPPLDRSRPLWQLWLLTGLADGRVALLVRLHHVIADGIAALELLSSVLDVAPDVEAAMTTGPPVTTSASNTPTPARLRHATARPRRLVAAAAPLALRARQVWAFARLGRAPRVSWLRPVGGTRTLALIRADLVAAKEAAHAHGGKLNDVVLAAVGGGAHRLLRSRGELVPGLAIHVAVAASVRRPGESGGNRVGIRLVPVPVDEPDAGARLEAVATYTAAARSLPPYHPNNRLLQRWMVRIMSRQRTINLVLSNMPGPTVPLYFAGARVQEMFQLSALQGNVGIGVGVLSYAGALNVDIVADPEIVPDIGIFVDGVCEAFVGLGVMRDRGAAQAQRGGGRA